MKTNRLRESNTVRIQVIDVEQFCLPELRFNITRSLFFTWFEVKIAFKKQSFKWYFKRLRKRVRDRYRRRVRHRSDLHKYRLPANKL